MNDSYCKGVKKFKNPEITLWVSEIEPFCIENKLLKVNKQQITFVLKMNC